MGRNVVSSLVWACFEVHADWIWWGIGVAGANFRFYLVHVSESCSIWIVFINAHLYDMHDITTTLLVWIMRQSTVNGLSTFYDIELRVAWSLALLRVECATSVVYLAMDPITVRASGRRLHQLSTKRCEGKWTVILSDVLPEVRRLCSVVLQQTLQCWRIWMKLS